MTEFVLLADIESVFRRGYEIDQNSSQFLVAKRPTSRPKLGKKRFLKMNAQGPDVRYAEADVIR